MSMKLRICLDWKYIDCDLSLLLEIVVWMLVLEISSAGLLLKNTRISLMFEDNFCLGEVWQILKMHSSGTL